MPEWTRVTSASDASALLPPWFAGRMLGGGGGGAFGLLLSTGDVLRAVELEAAHLSSDGVVLLDLVLDSAGVPEGTDLAWRQKHYLGTPLQGVAARATVNLAQVVAVVEFGTASRAGRREDEMAGAATGQAPSEAATETVEQLKRVAEDAATGVAATPPDTRAPQG